MSFSWKQFLLIFILLNFFGLHEFRKKVTYCPLEKVLFLKVSLYRFMYPAFCRRVEFDVDASHIFLQGVLTAIILVDIGLEMECLEQEQGVSAASSLLSDHLCCIESGILSQVAGVKALRVGLSWLCSFFFPASPHQELCPRAGKCWSKWGPCRLSAHVINSSANCIRYVACSGFCSGFPHSSQDKPWVQVHPVPQRWSTVPRLCHTHPVLKPHCRTGYACVYSQSIPGWELWWRSGSQRFGLLQMRCLSSCQQYSLPPQPGPASGLDRL